MFIKLNIFANMPLEKHHSFRICQNSPTGYETSVSGGLKILFHIFVLLGSAMLWSMPDAVVWRVF